MFGSRRAFRITLAAAGVTLAVATLLPMVFVTVAAGGFAPQYGEANLVAVSPAAAVSLALAIGLAGGLALRSEPRPLAHWSGVIGGVLVAAALIAAAYTFSPVAEIGFHPLGLSAVAAAGLLLVAAAWIGRRYGHERASGADRVAG